MTEEKKVTTTQKPGLRETWTWKKDLKLSLWFGFLAAIVRIIFLDSLSPFEQGIGFFLGIAFSMIVLRIFWIIVDLLDKKLPLEKNFWLRISIQTMAGIVVILSIQAVVFIFLRPYIENKISDTAINVSYFIIIIVVLGFNFGYFSIDLLQKWKFKLVEEEKMKKEQSMLQYDNLKNQLNPHFLFNSLASLNSLIHDQPDLASQFLQELSRVYRYVLDNRDKEKVSLHTELEFTDHYIFLMKTRFGDSINFFNHIQEDALEKKIIPVSLQILIENAIKHNTASVQHPLNITFETHDNYLWIRNNKQIKKIVETSNKMGLERLQNLYRFYADDPLIIDDERNEFIVKLPMLK